MGSPVVLGRVKSGAGAPTSRALVTLVLITIPASRKPNIITLHDLGGIISSPLSHAQCLYYPDTPAWSSAHRLSDNAIGSIQDLWSNRQPQRLDHLEIDHELDLRVHFHGDLRRGHPFADLVHQARGHL